MSLTKSNSKYQNSEIQKNSNDFLRTTLRNLFLDNELRLGESPSNQEDEVGIDFYFEVFTREANYRHLFLFVNQNKGTYNKIKKIKKNPNEEKISFQVELRHCRYWAEQLENPIVFTLCDMSNNKIYWYLVQNDPTILDRVQEQEKKGKKTLQIYIPSENLLDEQNFGRLLEEIQSAKFNQFKRKNARAFEDKTSDFSFLKEELKDKHIIDKFIYVIDLFECIRVFPEYILNKIFPVMFKSQTYTIESTLYTHSEEFYELIDKIDSNFKLSDNAIYVDNQEEKLKRIINFFQINLIEHISLLGRNEQRKGRLCVHKKYTYGDCDCERCSYKKLDFKRTEELIGLKTPDYDLYEKLRQGYAAYLYGNLDTAVDIFLEVYAITNEKNNPVIHIVSKFNLIQLKKINELFFNRFDSVQKKLLNIDDKLDEIFVTDNVQYFLDIFRSIKNFRFIYEAYTKIDKVVLEIKKIRENDKRGGWTSDNKFTSLSSSFLRTHNFLEHNLIILNHFDEYKSLTLKVLEGALVLNTLQNKETDKYKFGFDIIEMWIFHVKSENAKHLLKKYSIKNITTANDDFILQRINLYIENLNLSIENIKNNKSAIFLSDIENIISNIILIVSKLLLNKKQANEIFIKILNFIKNIEISRLKKYNDIISIVDSNSEKITKNNILNFIKSVDKETLRSGNFSFLIKFYVEKSTNKEIKKFVLDLLKTKTINNEIINKNNYNFRSLFYAYSLLDIEFKNELKKVIISSLYEKFDFELYNLASLFDIIEYDEILFKKYLEKIPNQNSKDYYRFFDKGKNYELESVINLAFKFNLPLNDLQKYIQYCHKEHQEYYKWLLNIDKYDYSKFNSYWLVDTYTIHYIREFRKSTNLKKAIEVSLADNYIEGVAKFYFNVLLSNNY